MTLNLCLLYFVWTEEYCKTSKKRIKITQPLTRNKYLSLLYFWHRTTYHVFLSHRLSTICTFISPVPRPNHTHYLVKISWTQIVEQHFRNMMEKTGNTTKQQTLMICYVFSFGRFLTSLHFFPFLISKTKIYVKCLLTHVLWASWDDWKNAWCNVRH